MRKRQNVRWEEMEKSTVKLWVLIQHFEVHNRAEGKSTRTVDWYTEVLGMFGNWLDGQRLSAAVAAITEIDVRQFILYIQARPGCKNGTMSTHSVANRVRALRAFSPGSRRKGTPKAISWRTSDRRRPLTRSSNLLRNTRLPRCFPQSTAARRSVQE